VSTTLARSETFFDEADDSTGLPLVHPVDEGREEAFGTRLTYRSVDVENISHPPVVAYLRKEEIQGECA